MQDIFKIFTRLVVSDLIALLVLVTFFLNNLLAFLAIPTQDFIHLNHAPSKEIAIVGIDDKSLERYGSWPWDRKLFADFINKLNDYETNTVVMDIILGEDRPNDQDFANAVNRSNLTLVLAAKVGEENELVRPNIINLLTASKINQGLANLPRDADSKVRTFEALTLVENSCLANLGLQGLIAFLKVEKPSNCQADNWQIGNSVLDKNTQQINLSGPRSTIATYSFADVMSNDFNANKLKNKLVFIGSTIQDLKLGLNDNILTPLGQIPGVEVQASVANTVLQNRILKNVSLQVELFIAISLLVFGSLIGRNWRIWLSLSTVFIISFVYLICALVIFTYNYTLNVFYPPLFLICGVIIGFANRYYFQFKENRYLKHAFSQYTDKKLLDQILASPDKLSLGGEKRFMTVLFSDIRGFTNLSETLTPEKLVQILNRYFTHATKKVFEQQGLVDKFIGDAIMAHWNGILDDEIHAYHACKSAYDLVSSLDEFNNENGTNLAIGVGISTGEMIVGNVGSDMRFDYTALGDKVNLGSRLESLTKKYKTHILISQETKFELDRSGHRNGFLIRTIDEVKVKGKDKSEKIYEIIIKNNSPTEQIREMIKAYETAFNEYQKGNFGLARADFHRLSRIYRDETSQVMSRRCKLLLQQPPKSWDGTWEWSEK